MLLLCISLGLAGLSISLALSVTQSLNWTVRMASDMESQMVHSRTFTNYTSFLLCPNLLFIVQVSVERVKTYAAMEQERPHYLPSDPSVTLVNNVVGDRVMLNDTSSSNSVHQPRSKSAWPTEGSITFSNVVMRYRPGLPNVLNNLNLTVSSREKIGALSVFDFYLCMYRKILSEQCVTRYRRSHRRREEFNRHCPPAAGGAVRGTDHH